MSSTLLLRFSAPMQAWGTVTQKSIYNTNEFPTRSGIVGILAASKGYDRYHSLDEFEKFRIGIRVDRQGEVLEDYQLSGTQWLESKDRKVSTRRYLTDAVFLVGIEGEKKDLEALAKSIKKPVFPLFFGRKNCLPTCPIVLEIIDETVDYALKSYEKLADKSWGQKEVKIYLEEPVPGEVSRELILNDIPVRYPSGRMQYLQRRVYEYVLEEKEDANVHDQSDFKSEVQP